MADYAAGLKNVDQLGQSLVSDQLEATVVGWLQWGLLGIGAFTNVGLGTFTPYGSLPAAKLRPVVDPRYTSPAGQTYAFEGVRSDWVWESGVPYASQPTAISGVYVNNAFVPNGSGVTICYPEGRVVFDTLQPTGTDVRVEHTYRQVVVRRADEPWFQEFVFRSYRADEEFQLPPGSGGAWDVLAQNRVQLPALVVETVDRVRSRPLELGNSSRIHQQPVLVHVVAETPWDRRRLHDILCEQYDKRIPSFDRNAITFPLDYRGTPVSGAMTFSQLVQAYPWRQIRVADVESTQQESMGRKLYWTTVRLTLELDAP